MKVLVTTNCATQSYHAYCSKAFPGGDVRAAKRDRTAKWIEESYAPFMDFVGDADLIVTDDVGVPWFEPLTRSGAEIRMIPTITFRGHRPDSFQLFESQARSPNGGGRMHSRIAASAFINGLTQREARLLFTLEHYEALGYVDGLPGRVRQFHEAFAQEGIEIGDLFERWLERGDFMYTFNHPHGDVLHDVAHRALGDVTGLSDAQAQKMQDEAPDFLEIFGVWPVYPPLGEAFGLPRFQRRWRSPRRINDGEYFGVKEMVARTYRSLANGGETARDAVLKWVGGEAEVARLCGGRGAEASAPPPPVQLAAR